MSEHGHVLVIWLRMVINPAVQVKWLKEVRQLETRSKHKKIRQFQRGRQGQESRSKKHVRIRKSSQGAIKTHKT